jgi:hypothetical protein
MNVKLVFTESFPQFSFIFLARVLEVSHKYSNQLQTFTTNSTLQSVNDLNFDFPPRFFAFTSRKPLKLSTLSSQLSQNFLVPPPERQKASPTRFILLLSHSKHCFQPSLIQFQLPSAPESFFLTTFLTASTADFYAKPLTTQIDLFHLTNLMNSSLSSPKLPSHLFSNPLPEKLVKSL